METSSTLLTAKAARDRGTGRVEILTSGSVGGAVSNRRFYPESDPNRARQFQRTPLA